MVLAMNSRLFELKRILKQAAIQTGLEAFSISSDFGFHNKEAGQGAIFTLHRVEPHIKRSFDPNAHLSVTPDFLDNAIQMLLTRGYNPISLSQLPDQLASGDDLSKIMCFTLDDGYLNNITHALPIFEKHNIPFTVFPCSGFVERTHHIWWETLMSLIAKLDHIDFELANTRFQMRSVTPAQKHLAFELIGQHFIGPSQKQATADLFDIAQAHGIDPIQLVDDLIMDRDDVQKLSRHPLAEIGAHTVSHPVLSHISDQDLSSELEKSRDHLAGIIGYRPPHLAYPYGDCSKVKCREAEVASHLGFELAVTTSPNVLKADTVDNIYQLPRISLNGYYQKANYVDALASGAIFKFLKTG